MITVLDKKNAALSFLLDDEIQLSKNASASVSFGVPLRLKNSIFAKLLNPTGTTDAIAKNPEPKKRIPTTPSTKKFLNAAGTTTAITTIPTTSRQKKNQQQKQQQQQQQRSKRAVKPDDLRRPLCKPTDTPTVKAPLRTKRTGGKKKSKSRSPRLKGTTSGAGTTGGGGSRVDASGGAASGGGGSSPSKRPTPR